MAIPSTPTNFFTQQDQGQIYLSWNIQAGATSYDVQRSIDGVSYSSVATPAVNEYLDTSAIVNTQYYYKVASVNASGTSSYTTPQIVIPTLAGNLSLGELRLRSQQRADRVNSPFVTLPEWNFFIRQSAYELYDLLITVYEDYYVAPRLFFTTDGSSESYALPNGQNLDGAPAFYKGYGLDLGLDNSANAFVTLKKFDFISRNQYVFPQITSSLLGIYNLRYRFVGSNIMFSPIPSAGQQIGLWYFPRLSRLLKDTDVIDGISGWTQYVIVRAAKYALDKEESDTTKLDAELLFLKQRIEESAMNRDAGSPDTISNTRTTGARWGMDGDGGSYGFNDGGW